LPQAFVAPGVGEPIGITAVSRWGNSADATQLPFKEQQRAFQVLGQAVFKTEACF
jgi:hypothetical protein